MFRSTGVMCSDKILRRGTSRDLLLPMIDRGGTDDLAKFDVSSDVWLCFGSGRVSAAAAGIGMRFGASQA